MSDEVINKKEKLLIEYLISSREIFAKCHSIAKPEFFEAPLDRVVEFVKEYFQKYTDLPNPDQIEAEFDIVLKQREMDKGEHDFFLEEFEEFCRNSAMSNAILESVDHVNEGDYGVVDTLIRDALSLRIDRNLGTDIFEDVEGRIERAVDTRINYSTGSKQVDELIGNVRRGEIHVVYAPSGGGKSLWLANQSVALAKQGLDVYVISTELDENLYSKRFDVMITQTAIKEYSENVADIAFKMEEAGKSMGSIMVKQMLPGTTASEINAVVMEYELEFQKPPDVLVVDYIGRMGSSSKSSNKYDIDEEKIIGLQRIAVKNDLICLTAQQLNRESADVVRITYAHVAGGKSIVDNSDSSYALFATEEDYDNNQAQVQSLKIRNAEFQHKPIILYKNPKTLTFSDDPVSSQPKESPVTKHASKSAPSPAKAKKEQERKQREEKVETGSGKEKLKEALKLIRDI